MVRQDTPSRLWHQARKARDLRKLEALAAMKHRIDLDDAAVILAVIAEKRPAAYDNAARRWLARLCVEKPFTAWGSEMASYDTIAPSRSRCATFHATPTARELACELRSRRRARPNSPKPSTFDSSPPAPPGRTCLLVGSTGWAGLRAVVGAA